MAILSIPAVDTHKIEYKNGVITAKRVNTTVSIKFWDGDGSDLGFSVKVNNKGYLCDTNGVLYTNGVFVREDAVITYTGPSGTTSWTVKGISDTPVEDGKLLDVDGNVVWSANSSGNYTLNYNDLINKPHINEWSESQQDVVVTSQGSGEVDTVTVDKFAKFMVISAQTAPVDGTINLKLTPEVSNRWGQVIQVMNASIYPVQLKNASDDSDITGVRAGEIVTVEYTSALKYVVGGIYTVQSVTDTPSWDVVDGGPNWIFVNPDRITGWNPETDSMKIYLKNTGIKDLFISWRPNAAYEHAPLSLQFYDPDNTLVRRFRMNQNDTIHCIAHINGSYVDFVGDNLCGTVVKEYACNSVGGAGTEYSLSVDDDVDTAIAILDNETPTGTSGTPTNVDLNLTIGAHRNKRLKILLVFFQLQYAQLKLKTVKKYLTELTVNYTNCPVLVFSSSDWNAMVSPSITPFVKLELEFLPSGSGTNCIATAMLQTMWH